MKRVFLILIEQINADRALRILKWSERRNSATENTEDTEKNENDVLPQKIIAAAIEVHRMLGPGLLESIYEEALCHEFDLRKIVYRRQVEIDVIYKNKVIKGQRLDILVEEEVIVEIKSLSKLKTISQWHRFCLI